MKKGLSSLVAVLSICSGLIFCATVALTAMSFTVQYRISEVWTSGKPPVSHKLAVIDGYFKYDVWTMRSGPTWSGHSFSINLGLIAVISSVLPLWQIEAMRKRRRLRYRLAHGLCPACGYDLRGSRAQCPECGEMNKA
jgi:hypothetical protein